jgi:hypothetical protein
MHRSSRSPVQKYAELGFAGQNKGVTRNDMKMMLALCGLLYGGSPARNVAMLAYLSVK